MPRSSTAQTSSLSGSWTGRSAALRSQVDGDVVDVQARVTVNAAGPWVDAVRAFEDPHAGTSVRLSKGVHVLVPGGGDWSAALTVPQDDVRVTFAVPWYGLLLLGTTDTDYDGDPADVSVEPEDVTEILAEAGKALPATLLEPGSVRATYAGLRVLPLGDGGTATARRETVFSIGPGGMLSVAGGKLTTYRRVALDALERVRGPLGLGRIDRGAFPLPGASGGEPRLTTELDPEVEAHLRHLYGSRAGAVVERAAEDASLLERLHPDGPDIAAQAAFAVECEWATSRRGRPPSPDDGHPAGPRRHGRRRPSRTAAARLLARALRHRQHGLDDPVVAGAPAEVAGERNADVDLGRVRVRARGARSRRRASRACRSRTARHRGRGTPTGAGSARPVASPSTVVTSLPSACSARYEQLFTGSPSSSIMQAPHSESSQPSFAPVRPTASRTAASRLVPGSSSTG